MPKYDFKCDECHKVFEIEKSMDSLHPTECPACGLPGLRRVFNATAFTVLGDHYVRDRTPPQLPAEGVEIQPRSN